METLPESLHRRPVGSRVLKSARSQLVPISSWVGGTTTSSCSWSGTSWNALSEGACHTIRVPPGLRLAPGPSDFCTRSPTPVRSLQIVVDMWEVGL